MSKILIIAEAGVNHNGSMENAFKLIDVAKASGADYVKFQTFKLNKVVTKSAQMADYQLLNTKSTSGSQYDMLKNLELTEANHYELKKHAKKIGINFLSTGFDEESIDFLDKLGVDFFKIPSGEITNYPYLKHIASKNKPVILSTGMATLGDIEAAVNIFTTSGLSLNKIQILHCNTEYPTPMKDVNLLAMKTIEAAFGVNVGYSDHTLGIEIPLAAVGMGAKIIEKHFTLDKNMDGPDHRASLSPTELKDMITAIRNVEIAMSGSGFKRPSESEMKNIIIARKSIHLNVSLKNGTILSSEHLIMLRPGNGISPFDMEKLIGRKINRDLEVQHQLSWSDLS